jgi:multidrug efflux pump subunit AcrB
MTTAAVVASILPLAFSRGIGASQSQAIASMVVCGQTMRVRLTSRTIS